MVAETERVEGFHQHRTAGRRLEPGGHQPQVVADVGGNRVLPPCVGNLDGDGQPLQARTVAFRQRLQAVGR